jgi:hypothetical protein
MRDAGDGPSGAMFRALGNPAVRLGIVVSAALAAVSSLHDQGQLHQGEWRGTIEGGGHEKRSQWGVPLV